MGMTREKATKWLKTFKGRTGMAELSQAFDVAIEALEPKPMQKFDNVKQHIDRLAGDYKCWDERLSYEEALELSRMLEQEPIIDKIRNEITMLRIFNRQNVIEIIDKYKAERESKG